jgi:predicted nucleic-acid-binding protein
VIALDTNVLVRFLVGDDAAQARRVKALVGRLDAQQERAYVADMVLCELVWVLSRSYDFGRAQIAFALRRLAAAKQLRFESVDKILRALAAYETGRGDFADYLVREHAKAAGCDALITFDRKLLGDELFRAP